MRWLELGGNLLVDLLTKFEVYKGALRYILYLVFDSFCGLVKLQVSIGVSSKQRVLGANQSTVQAET